MEGARATVRGSDFLVASFISYSVYWQKDAFAVAPLTPTITAETEESFGKLETIIRWEFHPDEDLDNLESLYFKVTRQDPEGYELTEGYLPLLASGYALRHENMRPGVTYEVSVQAVNKQGEKSAPATTTFVIDGEIVPLQITGVEFSEDDDKKYLIAQGVGLIEYYATALEHSLVTLNGVAIPFCAASLGTTAQVIIDAYAVLFPSRDYTTLVTDDPPCYMIIDENSPSGLNINSPSVKIWIPNDFDTEAYGTLAINGSPAFVINPDAAQPQEEVEPSVTVGGVSPEDGPMTVPSRPTFTGKAEPFSTVVVTVQSDPVTCTTTADVQGNWSCTLPSDLPPGQHTLTVVVTTPSNNVYTLGPYSLTVSGGDQITNNDVPGAPNTGVQQNDSINTATAAQFITGAVVIAVAIAGSVLLGVWRMKSPRATRSLRR